MRRADSEKSGGAEKKKEAGRGLIPCPAGGSCGSCRRATRTARATGLAMRPIVPRCGLFAHLASRAAVC